MAVTTSGVSLTEVGAGRKYDLAFGYSTDGVTAKMYGFLLRPGSELEEITDLQDQEHLVQVSSPNATDRYSRFPKVSQGSWVGGGRQEFFVDPTRFYSTNGNLDTTKPGALQLTPESRGITFPTGWRYNNSPTQGVMPIATEGWSYYIGGGTSPATVNIVSNSPAGNYTVGPSGSNEVLDIQPYPGGLLFSVAGAGMYIQPGAGFGGSAATQLSTDYNDGYGFHAHGFDYFAGLIYYTNNAASPAKLMAISPSSGAVAGTTVFSIPPGEQAISTLCAYSQGIVFSSSLGAGSGFFLQAVLYVYTGSGTPTRVGTIQGYAVASCNCAGTAYILALTPQPYTQTPYSYTLYSLSGTTLTQVDDFRYLNSDFRPSTATGNPGFPRMYYDGRFLYVACPGIPVNVYDISNPSSSPFILGNTTGVLASRNQSHGAVMTTSAGLVEVGLDTPASGGFFIGYVYNDTTTTSQAGMFTSSSFDFSTPTLTKLFRSIEVELRFPLVSPSTIFMGFRVDNATTFTSFAPVDVTAQKLVGYLPPGTKGSRIQVQLQLQGSFTNTPVVRSFAVNATVGRVFRATVMAPHSQSLHSYGEDDQAVTAKDLIAVVQNAYRVAGGSCILMIPSALTTTLSEQVNATLQEYHIHQTVPGPREDSVVPTDMEAYIDLVFVEDV